MCEGFVFSFGTLSSRKWPRKSSRLLKECHNFLILSLCFHVSFCKQKKFLIIYNCACCDTQIVTLIYDCRMGDHIDNVIFIPFSLLSSLSVYNPTVKRVNFHQKKTATWKVKYVLNIPCQLCILAPVEFLIQIVPAIMRPVSLWRADSWPVRVTSQPD